MIENGRISRLYNANRPLFTAVMVFILLRIWFSLLGIVGVTFKPITVEPQNPYSPEIQQELESDIFQRLFLSPWYRFDTVHYLEIAEEGYPDNDHNSAFPPLFPALIRLVNLVIPSLMGSAMLGSNLAAILTFWLFYILIQVQVSETTAQRAMYWLAVFPTTFLLFQPYTESLFFALMLGTLITIQRKQWWWAGLLAGLATLTRFLGILITVVFIWEAYNVIRQQKSLALRREWVIPLLAGSLPLAFYVAHLLALKFIFHAGFPWEAISVGWVGQLGWPWQNFLGTVREIFEDPTIELQVGRVLSLVSSLFVPITLIITRKTIPISWQLFFWLLYITSVTYSNNGAFHSTFRYFLPIVPIYLFLGDVLVNRKAKLAGLALCLPVQAGLLIMFYMWIWVF